MNQIKIKRVGVVSTGWLFAVLWFCIYLIPLCSNQLWGKDCDVTITCPFMKIQPASSLAITCLIAVTPFLGFVTGIVAALCANLILWLSGGFKLNIEIDPSVPSLPANPHSPPAQESDGR